MAMASSLSKLSPERVLSYPVFLGIAVRRALRQRLTGHCSLGKDITPCLIEKIQGIRLDVKNGHIAIALVMLP